MAIRITCDVPAFDDTWIDVSERWTRRETKQLIEAEGEEWLDIFHRKVEACNIQTFDPATEDYGQPITDPKQVSEDALEDVDIQVYGFLGTSLLTAVGHLRTLGFTTGHVYSNGNDAVRAKATEKA